MSSRPTRDAPSDEGEPESLRPSHRERQAPGDRSQKLAHRLLALEASRAENVPLSPRVREVLDDARAMKPGNARRRQERRLAQVIRDDDEMDALAAAMDALGEEQRDSARGFQRIEEWRDALRDGRADVDALAATCGITPSPELVRQVALARDEATTGRHRGAGRALFKLLADVVMPTTPRPPG